MITFNDSITLIQLKLLGGKISYKNLLVFKPKTEQTHRYTPTYVKSVSVIHFIFLIDPRQIFVNFMIDLRVSGRRLLDEQYISYSSSHLSLTLRWTRVYREVKFIVSQTLKW